MTKSICSYIEIIRIQYSEFQNRLCKQKIAIHKILNFFLNKWTYFILKNIFHGDKTQEFCYTKALYFSALCTCGSQLLRFMLLYSLLKDFRPNISISLLINKHSGIRHEYNYSMFHLESLR